MEKHASVSLFMSAQSQTQDILAICVKHVNMVCGDDLFAGVDACCLKENSSVLTTSLSSAGLQSERSQASSYIEEQLLTFFSVIYCFSDTQW